MIRIKENAKPQVWYEEAENGYQVCVRKPHNDYFRTEYIQCNNKQEAKDLVQSIKENGYTNISKKDSKECTSDCTKAKNKNFSFGDDDYINIPVKKEEPETKEAPEEKPRAKFEFGDEDIDEEEKACTSENTKPTNKNFSFEDDDEVNFRKEMYRLRDKPIPVKETNIRENKLKIGNGIF